MATSRPKEGDSSWLRHSLIGPALTALAIGLAGSISSAGSKVDPVKIKASAGKSSGDKQIVLVELKIAKGWHVYANPADNDTVADSATVVRVKSAGKAIAATVNYPAGNVHQDSMIGKYKVYEDKVVIPVEFAKTNGQVQVSVTYQACDKSKCLKPATVNLNVK